MPMFLLNNVPSVMTGKSLKECLYVSNVIQVSAGRFYA